MKRIRQQRRTEFIPFRRRSRFLLHRTNGSSHPARAGVPRPRTAATLTEVLISLLIMSVGVVSVFTLFPISLLRAIQATQQTNARLHKLNTTEIVATNPQLLSVHSPPPGTPAGPRFVSQWRPNTQYTIGDIVTPTVSSGNPFPSPDLWFVCVAADDGSGMGNPPGRSGLVEPVWNTAARTNELNPLTGEAVAWAPLPYINVTANQRPYNDPLNPLLPWYQTDRYVVDPLGWAVAQAEGSFGRPFEFGNRTNAASGQGVSLPDIAADPFHLLRINGSVNTQTAAIANTALIDSWEPVVQATPQSVTNAMPGSAPGRIVFPSSVGLSGFNGALGYIRVTLVSTDGRMTATRPVSQISTGTNTVEFPQQSPLPIRFPTDSAGAPDVGLAIIEQFDRRYTWFLTVRKNAGAAADIKVVVVFNRKFLPEEEHVYNANFGNSMLDVNMDGNPDVGTSAQVRLNWTPGTEPEPLLRPGNFLFDARNVEWYRIQQVNVNDQVNGDALLTVDRTVVPTRDNGMGNPTPGWGRAILMRGIVDVYDL